MSTFICVKTCGLFRQGKTYHFEKPTAQALSASILCTRGLRE